MTEHIQHAYREDRNFPMTCAALANYFLLMGQLTSAEKLAQKAVELTDVNAIASDGWYLRARKEHVSEDYPTASDYYNRSDQARGGLDRGYLPAKFGMIQVQVQTKDLVGAKLRLEKLASTSRLDEIQTLLGCICAEEAFIQQTTLSKEEKSMEMARAISLLERVRKSWHESTRKIVDKEPVLLYLARLYESQSPVESERCLREVEELQLAKIKDEDPELEEGEDEQIQLRAFLPPQLLNNLACFQYDVENFEGARDTFQIALNACIKLSQKQEAEKEDPDSTEKVTDDVDALLTTISYNLARTYEAKDEWAEARKIYERLLDRHSDYTDAAARLAYMSLREQPTGDGPKKMHGLYQSDYGNIEVRALQGWYLNKTKRAAPPPGTEDPVQRHYKHTLQGYDKHDIYSLTGMGNGCLQTARDMPRNTDQERDKRRRMYDRAVEFFDKALQLDPKNAYAAQGIGIALAEDKKDFATAEQIFNRVKSTIRDTSVYLNLGHIYAELRQYQRAIDNYDLAIKHDLKDKLKHNKERKLTNGDSDTKANPQILACLSRIWMLKAKFEQSLSSYQRALELSQQALSTQPEMPHLQFNVAYIHFQIAQTVQQMKEDKRTSADVAAATNGLDEAIKTFETIAKSRAPPVPRQMLEQRAAMGRNTMKRQLDRAANAQRDYEEKNADKIRTAKESHEAATRRKQEEMESRLAEQKQREKQVLEERKALIEKTEALTQQQIAEQVAREAAEYTTDEETGERTKRQKKKRGEGGGKRGKRKAQDDDGFIEDDGDGSEAGIDRSGGSASGTPAISNDEVIEKPKKRRKLERKAPKASAKQSKYKSDERVVDSDSDDLAADLADPRDDGDAPTPQANDNGSRLRGSAGDDDDAEMPDADEETPRRKPERSRKQLRMIADDDEDEDEEGDMNGNIDAAEGMMATASDDD